LPKYSITAEYSRAFASDAPRTCSRAWRKP
jgi:hypothetical protein